MRKVPLNFACVLILEAEVAEELLFTGAYKWLSTERSLGMPKGTAAASILTCLCVDIARCGSCFNCFPSDMRVLSLFLG